MATVYIDEAELTDVDRRLTTIELALSGFAQDTRRRFDEMNQRFDALETRMDALETRMDALETKVDRILELLEPPPAA